MSLGKYVSEVESAISTLSPLNLEKALTMFKQAIIQRSRIIVAGNGGSAAISSHFVIDLSRCTLNGKYQTSAFSLNDNIPVITATANDLGYEFVFEYQLERFARPNDLFIGISSSGNSLNIVKALVCAKANKISTISLTGFDGGKASEISDLALVTKTDSNNYGPTEDAHAIICHYIARTLK